MCVACVGISVACDGMCAACDGLSVNNVVLLWVCNVGLGAVKISQYIAYCL